MDAINFTFDFAIGKRKYTIIPFVASCRVVVKDMAIGKYETVINNTVM